MAVTGKQVGFEVMLQAPKAGEHTVISGRDVIYGGEGDDTLVGGYGLDWLVGGGSPGDLYDAQPVEIRESYTENQRIPVSASSSDFSTQKQSSWPDRVLTWNSAQPALGDIQDPNLSRLLQRAVLTLNGIDDPDTNLITRTKVHASDLVQLTRLVATGAGITSLTGIEYAANLRVLALGNNSISDLSKLSALTQLQYVSLDGNPIRSSIPLTSSALKGVSVDYCWGSTNNTSTPPDLRGLLSSWSETMRFLSLDGNDLPNFTGLEKFPNLLWLSLEGNRAKDTESLGKLSHPQYVYLARNYLADVTAMLLTPDGQARWNQLQLLTLKQNPLNNRFFENVKDQYPIDQITYDNNPNAPKWAKTDWIARNADNSVFVKSNTPLTLTTGPDGDIKATDADGGKVSYWVKCLKPGGELELGVRATVADGKLTLTPEKDFRGEVIVQVVASDGPQIAVNPSQYVSFGRQTSFAFILRVGVGVVTGFVWKDNEKDGEWAGQVSEPGVKDATVYIDADRDGQLDVGEVFVQTDSIGAFTLMHVANLADTTELVRLLVPEAAEVEGVGGDGYSVSFGEYTIEPAQVIKNQGFGLSFYANSAPELSEWRIGDGDWKTWSQDDKFVVTEGQLLQLDIRAKNAEGKALSFTLQNTGVTAEEEVTNAKCAPTDFGAQVKWIPTASQAKGTGAVYTFKLTVQDAGLPPKDCFREFSVTVVKAGPVFESANGVAVPTSHKLEYRIREGQRWSLAIVARHGGMNVPPDALRFLLESAPEGLSADEQSGDLTWVASEAQRPGTFKCTLRAYEDSIPDNVWEEASEVSSTLELSITVEKENRAPVVYTPGSFLWKAGVPLSFDVTAKDPDGDALEYAWNSSFPNGMTLSPMGKVEWSKPIAGIYEIAVKVVDTMGWSATTGLVQITVLETDNPPVVEKLVLAGKDGEPDQELRGTSGWRQIEELSEVSAILVATDVDGDRLVFSAEKLPAGATFNAETGVLKWRPTDDQGGSHYKIELWAWEERDPTKVSSFVLELDVRESYESPLVASVPKQTVPEGTSVTVPLLASDPNQPTSPLRFRLLGYHRNGAGKLVEDTTFASVDARSGVFSWTPNSTFGGDIISPVVRVYADVQQNGEFDSGDPYFDRAFDIAVARVDRPPVFTPMALLTARELQTVSITVHASDPDGRALIRYELNNATLGAVQGLVLNSVTGLLSWTPGESDGGRVFSAGVKATEYVDAVRGLCSEQVLTFAVEEENSVPTVDSAQYGESGPALPRSGDSVYARVVAGETLSLKIQLSDQDRPDNGLFCTLAAGSPADATLTRDNDAFMLNWKSASTTSSSDVRFLVQATDNGSPAGSTMLNVLVRVVNGTVAEGVRNGDANGDGVTNELDLYQVWQTVRRPAAARNLNDDLNGDHRVDADDVELVRQHLGWSRKAALLAHDNQMKVCIVSDRQPSAPAETAVVVAPEHSRIESAAAVAVSVCSIQVGAAALRLTGGSLSGVPANTTLGGRADGFSVLVGSSGGLGEFVREITAMDEPPAYLEGVSTLRNITAGLGKGALTLLLGTRHQDFTVENEFSLWEANEATSDMQ